jgi:transcription initiation factor TFIIB
MEKTQQTCPECKSNNIIVDRGEIVCRDCGTVITMKVFSTQPEWRAFSHDEMVRKMRVGPATDTSLSIPPNITSVISMNGSKKHTLTVTEKMRMLKLRKLHKTVINEGRRKSLLAGMREAERLTSVLGLSHNVYDETMILFKKAVESDLLKGHSVEGMVAASLYAVCRLMRIPVKLSEIIKNSVKNDHEIKQSYKKLVKHLKIRIPLQDPLDYVEKIVNALNMSPLTRDEAKNIVNRAREKGITISKDPAGIAAAAVYIAGLLSDEKKKKKEIAKVAGISEITLNNRFEDLLVSENLTFLLRKRRNNNHEKKGALLLKLLKH